MLQAEAPGPGGGGPGEGGREAQQIGRWVGPQATRPSSSSSSGLCPGAVQEYLRAAYTLRAVPGALPAFLRLYAKYLAGEKRKE